MEKEQKQKKYLWIKFETTGKIEDYLSFKNFEKLQKEENNGKLNNNKSNSPEVNPFSR